MRIERLNETTKKTLLEDLLKRSPNQYGAYEADVKKILDEVKEKKMRRYLPARSNSTKRTSTRRISG